MTAHEVLVKARNLIADEKAWCPKGTDGTDGSVCAAMAINAVLVAESFSSSLYWSACGAVARAVDLPPSPVELGRWNDHPATTHSDVLAAFDKAIAATAPEPDVSFVTEPVAVA